MTSAATHSTWLMQNDGCEIWNFLNRRDNFYDRVSCSETENSIARKHTRCMKKCNEVNKISLSTNTLHLYVHKVETGMLKASNVIADEITCSKKATFWWNKRQLDFAAHYAKISLLWANKWVLLNKFVSGKWRTLLCIVWRSVAVNAAIYTILC